MLRSFEKNVCPIFTVTLGWLNTLTEEEESLEIVYFHDKMYHLAIRITVPVHDILGGKFRRHLRDSYDKELLMLISLLRPIPKIRSQQ